MDRKQVERIAKKVGLALRKADGMEKAQWDAEWALGEPGWQPRNFFRNLRDAYDYCAINRGGQEAE